MKKNESKWSKRSFLSRLAMAGGAVAFMPHAAAAAEAGKAETPAQFRMAHGPYLQDLREHGVIIAFKLNAKGAAWVELREAGQNTPIRRVAAVREGLCVANTEAFDIAVDGLKAATPYQYRIVAKPILKFNPYKVVYGEELVTDWFSFKTLDPKATRCAVLAMSDLHSNPNQLQRLLELGDYKSCSACFLVGDIINDCTAEDLPYTKLIDKSVAMFATQHPLVMVRGNHETRGAFARGLHAHFPSFSGKWYGAMTIGDCFFIYLDSGEDKPNDNWAYFGLADFDAYRSEEAEWLKTVVNGEAFRRARHRIVFSHFPLAELPQYIGDPVGDYGARDLSGKCLPILNGVNIDLCVAGHTHRFAWHDVNPQQRKFPLLVGSNRSAVRLDIDENGIRIKAYDTGGKTLLEKTLSKQK